LIKIRQRVYSSFFELNYDNNDRLQKNSYTKSMPPPRIA